MAETTQFVSRISVKDLITAFENKSETVRVEFSRPRARSFGNVLNKNVIVRLNEFLTLEDIEKGLTKLETNLNFYEVYNKAKHVAFQEQFFNILTSIANIENDDEDTPVRKKRLISRTQTLVSFLNQKLPSNINQVIEEKPKQQYKYTPYSYTKSDVKTELSSINSGESKLSNGSDGQPGLYVEGNGTADVTDSGRSYIVSVKKLKENFQQKKDEQAPLPIKQEKTPPKPSQNLNEPPKIQNSEPPKPEVKQTQEQPIKEDSRKEEKGEALSVTKLRTLFEQRTEENSKGLEIITVDKSQLTKSILGGSVQNISIPFTERNLGTFRLQRSVSGNYMNYTGLLKRIDINRSNSSFEAKKEITPIPSESISDENSDAESENTLENGDDSVIIEELQENDSPVISEEQEEQQTFTSKTEYISMVKKTAQVQVKQSSKFEQEENNNNIEHNLSNGTTILRCLTPAEGQQLSLDSDIGSHQEDEQDLKEETNVLNASYGRSSSSELSFQSADETEVHSGTPVIENVPVEENIAKFENTSSESTEIDSNTSSEHELSFKGVDEIKVNTGRAESKPVEVKENFATLEIAHEAVDSENDEETNNFITENTKDDEISSAFSSLLELEDEREQSLIDEEIKKIDVEQTLANADLVINPEDLKNADDEFEKLMENTESSKKAG